MRARVGRLLRRWADRIDPGHAPRALGWSFTMERKSGLTWRHDQRGCPVWYIGSADFDRAYTEAETDWRGPQEKLSAMLDEFGEDMMERPDVALPIVWKEEKP